VADQDFDEILLTYCENGPFPVESPEMIIYHTKSDIFDLPTEALCHGVNIRGVTGGLAHAVFTKYPDSYQTYKEACDNGLLTTGMAFATHEHDRLIYNLTTQDNPGPSASLLWVQEAFVRMRAHAVANHVKSIACPKIGAGIGGLSWPDVEGVIKLVWETARDIELHFVTQEEAF
jgi:O-acetyl-ADP-ribose deacetylase (regulator of RNase III)